MIASPDDLGALRVARVLRCRAELPILLVSVEQLLLSPEWRHDPLGESRVVLGNGAILSDRTIAAVLNRVGPIDPPQFARARAPDRLYAQGEFFSLILSWLAGLGGRVVNPPHPGNLMGTRGSVIEDRIWARRLGAAVAPATIATNARLLPSGDGVLAPYRMGELGMADELTPDPDGPVPAVVLGGRPAIRVPDPAQSRRRMVTVVGDRVVERGLPARVAAEAVRLAKARNLPIAEIELMRFDDGGYGFGVVSPRPALGSPDAAEAVADLLLELARERRR